jgi:hypothetical protein
MGTGTVCVSLPVCSFIVSESPFDLAKIKKERSGKPEYEYNIKMESEESMRVIPEVKRSLDEKGAQVSDSLSI